MIHLTHVSPDELTQGDLELVDSYARSWSYTGMTALDYLKAIVAKSLVIFRVSGDADGVIGVERRVLETSKELWLSFGLGKGLVVHAAEIKDSLINLFRPLGYDRFFVVAGRPGMGRVYERLGLDFRSATYVQEMTHV